MFLWKLLYQIHLETAMMKSSSDLLSTFIPLTSSYKKWTNQLSQQFNQNTYLSKELPNKTYQTRNYQDILYSQLNNQDFSVKEKQFSTFHSEEDMKNYYYNQSFIKNHSQQKSFYEDKAQNLQMKYAEKKAKCRKISMDIKQNNPHSQIEWIRKISKNQIKHNQLLQFDFIKYKHHEGNSLCSMETNNEKNEAQQNKMKSNKTLIKKSVKQIPAYRQVQAVFQPMQRTVFQPMQQPPPEQLQRINHFIHHQSTQRPTLITFRYQSPPAASQSPPIYRKQTTNLVLNTQVQNRKAIELSPYKIFVHSPDKIKQTNLLFEPNNVNEFQKVPEVPQENIQIRESYGSKMVKTPSKQAFSSVGISESLCVINEPLNCFGNEQMIYLTQDFDTIIE